MFYFVVPVAVILVYALLSARTRDGESVRAAKAVPEALPPDDIADLALEDPVEALLRYGTPADAARLAEQGVDLGGLGYRPGGS